MRIGELSRRTGVAIPTIKYYVREGLLPPGELTSPNQASYDESHERRLRLVRALIDVGGLSVQAVGEVLGAVDNPAQPLHEVLGAATKRMMPRYGDAEDPELAAAREEVAALIERRGWRVPPDSPAARSLAGALAAMERVGHGDFAEEVLDQYAQAAEQVAVADLAYVGRNASREDLLEMVVIGTVLGEAVLAATRRMAHQNASARVYGDRPPGAGDA
ncbi:MerR family transcriptional regulator [Streptomyces mauvecolor]